MFNLKGQNQNKQIDVLYKSNWTFYQIRINFPATCKQTSQNICVAPKSYQGINIKETTKNELLKTLRSLKTYNILLKSYTIIILKNQASHNISIDKNYNRYDNCSWIVTFGLSKLMTEIWIFRIYYAKFTLKNSVFLSFNIPLCLGKRNSCCLRVKNNN